MVERGERWGDWYQPLSLSSRVHSVDDERPSLTMRKENATCAPSRGRTGQPLSTPVNLVAEAADLLLPPELTINPWMTHRYPIDDAVQACDGTDKSPGRYSPHLWLSPAARSARVPRRVLP